MIRHTKSDDGFSLMEAIVASVILAVSAVIVATLLLGTLRVTSDTGRRTSAADIAASQLETLRQLSASDIPNGQVDLPAKTIDGTTYAIKQEATYTTYNGATSACTGTGKLAAKRVTVTVTWTNMGQTKPVTTETLRGLGFDASSGGLDATKGSLAAYVLDGSGQPVSGAQVILKSQGGSTLGTQTTGADGCAVFTNLNASTNVYASATKTGFVDVNGYDAATDTGSGVVANAVAKSTLQLGVPGTLSMSMTSPSGSVMPLSYSATAFKPYVTSSVWPSISSVRNPPACASATPPQVCLTGTTVSGTTLNRLIPAAYGPWFGSCLDARPATLPLTMVTSGGSSAVNAMIAAVRVSPASVSAVGKTVTATHAVDSACAAGETITVALMPAIGSSITVALPPGLWTLSVPSGTTPGTKTLVSGSVTPVSVG